MVIPWSQVASVAASEPTPKAPLVAAFVVGGLLTALGWQLSDSLREQEASHEQGHSASEPEFVQPVTCPPAPECPSVECEPSSGKATPERIKEAEADTNASESEVGEDVQASLSEIMREVGVRASFDLDCSTHPCLAVFADTIPSPEDRAVIVDRMMEARLGGNLISSTSISKDHRVSWVLVLADGELTEADELSVRARVEELLH
jgi:hypothetical protein